MIFVVQMRRPLEGWFEMLWTRRRPGSCASRSSSQVRSRRLTSLVFAAKCAKREADSQGINSACTVSVPQRYGTLRRTIIVSVAEWFSRVGGSWSITCREDRSCAFLTLSSRVHRFLPRTRRCSVLRQRLRVLQLRTWAQILTWLLCQLIVATGCASGFSPPMAHKYIPLTNVIPGTWAKGESIMVGNS